MTKKFRPFENFAEFKKVTGCDIGTAITTRFKTNTDEVMRLIVSFNDNVHTVGLGTATYSYKEILDNYLFFNEKTGKFEPLGIEEEQEEPEKVKPAKFKVGHVYIDRDGNENTVIAKYRSPINSELCIVVSDEDEELVIYEVMRDINGNEFAYSPDDDQFSFYAVDDIKNDKTF